MLDLGLPDLDGKEVLRRLREWSQVPVLVLTVRDTEAETIAALDLGGGRLPGTKPFRALELVAPAGGPVRRQPAAENTVVRFGGIEIDVTRIAAPGRR